MAGANAEVSAGRHRCAGCSASLAADNTSRLCSRCHRDQRDQLRIPPVQLSEDFWTTDDFQAAFDSQHIGRVLKAYRNHPRYLKLFGKALNQEVLGRWLGLAQAQVSKLENGRPEQNLETLRRYAEVLHIPHDMLWFNFPGETRRATRETLISLQGPIVLEQPPSTALFTWPETSDLLTSHLLADRPEPGLTRTLAIGIRDTTADLMIMDFKRGGGHTRRMLRHYYEEEVAPLLSWQYSDKRIRNEIYSAASETLQLLGWSAYDAGDHQSARRYFRQALQLAQKSDDILMAGRILSNLSHQANFLGNFADALALAQKAEEITKGRAGNIFRSMVVSMQARAHANLGDTAETTLTIHRAQELHNKGHSASDPEWLNYFTAQEIASEAAHCFRDLGDADKCREFADLSMDPVYTPPRTLGFMRLVAASGTLAGGDIEHAAALATEAIELSISLQSARYVKYVTDFHGALNAKDRALGRQVAELLRNHYPVLTLPHQ